MTASDPATGVWPDPPVAQVPSDLTGFNLLDKVHKTMGVRGDRPEDDHPERYAPNAAYGVHLKTGELETRTGTDENGVPIEYDVTPRHMKDVEADRKAGKPVKTEMGRGESIAHLMTRVPSSERPVPYLYRTMSEAEYQGAKKNGYIKSNGSMNLADEGTVASDRSTGSFYMQPGDNRIVRIKHDLRDGWKRDPADEYVKTHNKIPFDRVDMVSPKMNMDEHRNNLHLAFRLHIGNEPSCCAQCLVASFKQLGSWDTVQEKALRLVTDNHISDFEETPEQFTATVRGDTGTYVTVLVREKPTNKQCVGWSCDCGWGQHAFLREHQYVGRVCSHALALLMFIFSDRYPRYDPEGYATEEGLS